MVSMMEDFVELPLHPSGCYMLVWRGRVVYVGQSVNVLARVAKHRYVYEAYLKSKPVRMGGSPNEFRVIAFEKAYVKFCGTHELDRLEMQLIAKHEPELNTNLRRNTGTKIDLGKLGFDGERWRNPLLPKTRYPNGRPDFCSPFNKHPRLPRPRLVA